MGEKTELRWPLLTRARSLFPRSPAGASLWEAGQAQSSRSKEKSDFFFCSHNHFLQPPTHWEGRDEPFPLSCAAAASQEDSQGPQEDPQDEALMLGVVTAMTWVWCCSPISPGPFRRAHKGALSWELEPSGRSAAFQGTPQALRKGPPKAAAGFKGVSKGRQEKSFVKISSPHGEL